MRDFVVNELKACESIRQLLNHLVDKNMQILEIRIEDYHFHQLYVKVEGDFKLIDKAFLSDMLVNDFKISCKCHWSTVELFPNTH